MSWYDYDKTRVVLEYRLMYKKYPSYVLCKFEEKLAWEGEVTLIPEGIDAEPMKVRLVYPEGYPVRPPKVYPLYPELPKELWGHEWHRWEGGYICHVQPKLWNVRYTAVDVIEKIHVWYFNYLAYVNKLIPKMPDEGIADISKNVGD
ncbi:hypothetical protein FRZ06_11395 [Anoxybacterium hadale]|uniref:Uncharacterized protein n=1 Tax=Anoxybacterium hadale TaxID=3408580 RepID=A0ACD1ABD4_9FIRM|nr:hypothetical protein FRZ06_11395 [Clostridiales bacterium]